jgi:hypothetical protein
LPPSKRSVIDPLFVAWSMVDFKGAPGKQGRFRPFAPTTHQGSR